MVQIEMQFCVTNDVPVIILSNPLFPQSDFLTALLVKTSPSAEQKFILKNKETRQPNYTFTHNSFHLSQSALQSSIYSFLFCYLSKEHCRMLSQNVHGREVYVQPSGCAGDAMCLHGLIERNMKAKSSVKQQPADAPKVMLI